MTRTRRGTVALAAAGALALGGHATPARSASPQFTGSVAACAGGTGSVVAVDFAAFGGPIALGCDTSHPARGIDLLTDTGFTTAGDRHDGPRFLCRIGSVLFASGTEYPTPAQDPCIATPPASAYWSYWLAPAGQDTWTYSKSGAYSDVPEAGEVQAWTFGATDIAGSTGQPAFDPDAVRAQEAPATAPAPPPPAPPAPTPPPTTTAITTVAPAPAPPAIPRVTFAGANLTAAARYLVTTSHANGLAHGTTLGKAGYYESGPRFADFGLTIDAVFALVAAHRQQRAVHRAVSFIAGAHRDGSRRSINSWTGIGTRAASGGSIAKEALLAETVGADPRHFAGHDLIAALDRVRCTGTGRPACAGGAGSYRYGSSTFDEALAIIAQLRAGDRRHAAPAVAYLLGHQHPDGAWPSEIPSTGDSDVDSTAMAAMALAIVPHNARAARAEQRGLAWIAHRQERDGGFPGAAGDSTNSAALAIQALGLHAPAYPAALNRARAFLAREQNRDGGFAIAAGGSRSSDVRASTQVLGGLVGTSFATLGAR